MVGGPIGLAHKLMASTMFFEQTAAIVLLAMEITNLLNLCLDNMTKVACDHECKIWNTENKRMKADNKMTAANLMDLELKWDDKELEDGEGQLHCLMAKFYQYTLGQESVRYHHDTFAENKTSLFEIQ